MREAEEKPLRQRQQKQNGKNCNKKTQEKHFQHISDKGAISLIYIKSSYESLRKRLVSQGKSRLCTLIGNSQKK